MWNDIPVERRNRYRDLMQAFASLTRLFDQKETDHIPSPIIFSKFQEKMFCSVIGANGEDVGNTPYDASLILKEDVLEKRFLIGIKTFSHTNESQKVAQMKSSSSSWSQMLAKIKDSSNGKTKEEIDAEFHDIYLQIAREISKIRNARMESAKANLKGFNFSDGVPVESVYHVLMPSNPKSEGEVCLYVGECPYDEIDIDNITIYGCTNSSRPDNFSFTDGRHEYRYTSADSQLYMNFNNRKIELEKWPVSYLDDPIKFLDMIIEMSGKEKTEIEVIKREKKPEIAESHSWALVDKDGEVERYSGLNAFYGVGSKMGEGQRKNIRGAMEKLFCKDEALEEAISHVERYLNWKVSSSEERRKKEEYRSSVVKEIEGYPIELKDYVMKKLFRPTREIYIPLPSSYEFHKTYPRFFLSEGIRLDKEKRILNDSASFPLVFHPSLQETEAIICQQAGKGIESKGDQGIMGRWILEGVLNLKPYEPVTKEVLNAVGINGIRFFKLTGDERVHAEFTWIDLDNPPLDYWK